MPAGQPAASARSWYLFEVDSPADDRDGALWTLDIERGSGEKVSRQIARAIVRDIVRLELHEGAPLPPEPAMLAQYGIGRPALREALRILEINGLITIRPGRGGGPRVRRSDTADLGRILALHLASRRATYEDVDSARLKIESMLARLAALNATESERQQLAEILHQSSDASSDEVLGLGKDFHRGIAIYSHEAVLGPLSLALHFVIEPVRAQTRRRRRSTWFAEHIEIGEAIIRGDADEAERLMANHMSHYSELALKDQIVDWA